MSYPNNIPSLTGSKTANFTFAGIGSRETPIEVQQLLYKICNRLVGVYQGRMYSGNAEGADWACQEGASEAIKEFSMDSSFLHIYLPYKNFSINKHPHVQSGYYIDVSKLPNYEHAKEYARKNHPLGDNLQPHQLQFHARNAYQVFSWALLPAKAVDFIICWTKDGAEHSSILQGNRPVTKDTGGTGMAITLASEQDIPVFNLANDDAISRLHSFLSTSQFI